MFRVKMGKGERAACPCFGCGFRVRDCSVPVRPRKLTTQN